MRFLMIVKTLEDRETPAGPILHFNTLRTRAGGSVA